ncbi:MAG: hypothetical protein P1T08_03730 [Acidimicrobiia bacterium]|nr:hypothetical protein [Acidimicrobiia bacterium]
MTDSAPEVLGSTAADAGAEPHPSLLRLEARHEEPTGRSESFEACVEDIRRWYGGGGDVVDLVSGLAGLIRRRLGVAPQSPGAAMVAVLTGSGIRLLPALLAAVLFGQWTEIPWGRWAVILAFYGFLEGSFGWMNPPPGSPLLPRVKRIVENWTALLPTIVRESDLRDLADFTRRWISLPVVVVAGVAVAAMMILACALFTPAALGELPAGSVVLLAWLLFDFGVNTVYYGEVFQRVFMAREARYDHHLFWPSPADSPEVHKVTRKTTNQGFAAGLWITAWLVLAVVLVGWDSPLVLPLAVGFVVIGYLTTIGLAFGNRASVRKIVERSRQQRLALFRSRIDTFEPRMVDLSPEESEQLRDLLFLHHEIRDAPTSSTATHTAVRTAAGLLIPTIVFVITVFGEVSAERILDAILP